jgi:hypothetical protein
MSASLKTAIIKYPSSFGVWGMFVQCAVYGLNEIAVIGKTALQMTEHINQLFVPNKILIAAIEPVNVFHC